MVFTGHIEVNTRGNADVLDITMDVTHVINQSGMQDGIVNIFSPSATSALTTIEYESGCVSDLQRLFDEILDPNRHYAHNARWGDGNGHSHARAALLGPSLTVPFTAGTMQLGTWQQIILVDFDNRGRHRRLVVQVMGE